MNCSKWLKITLIIITILIAILIISCLLKRNLSYFKNKPLYDIHKKLKLKNGSFKDEFPKQITNFFWKFIFKTSIKFKDELPEQITILKYLPSDAKVLEFGGNIGRSSLIINYILKDKTQQLTIESDSNISKKLKENRDLNGAKFEILEGVISNKKFIQRGWNTKQSDKLESGFKWVSNYPLENVLKKYNIHFDTIVADCEGCLVGFFKEYPNFIKQIKLIIIEHDFNDKEDLNYFKNLMFKNNLKKIHVHRKDESDGPGINWVDGIIEDPDFITVWKKIG